MSRVVMLRSNPIRPYPRLEKMANALTKMGHEVTVIAWDRDNNYKARREVLNLKEKDIGIIRIGIKGQFSGGIKKNGLGLLKFELFLFRWLTKHRNEYDIIHAYDFDCGYVAFIVSKLLKKRLIYDIADYYVDSHRLTGTVIGGIVENKEIKVINKADAVILCTEERVKQIAKASPRKVVFIHNTPDLAMVNKTLDAHITNESNRIKLVYVGVLGRDRFIDQIAEVVKNRSDCEFHIGGFGGGMEDFFKSLSAESNNVFFYGCMPYEKTIELERECDIMCAMYDPSVPNNKFAAPNKFYEALALGKPLIMVKNTGMADIIKEKGIGMVIDFDKESLNVALDKLVEIKDTFAEMSLIERDMYEREYSWGIMESRITELYNSIS